MSELQEIRKYFANAIKEAQEELPHLLDTCEFFDIKLSEFKKYAPIFPHSENSGIEKISAHNLRELSREYFSIVSPYKKVRVIDDNTNEVIRILPAAFRKVDLLNASETDSRDFANTIYEFSDMIKKANFEYQKDAALRKVIVGLVDKQDAKQLKKDIIDFKTTDTEFKKLQSAEEKPLEKIKNNKEFNDSINEEDVVIDGEFIPD